MHRYFISVNVPHTHTPRGQWWSSCSPGVLARRTDRPWQQNDTLGVEAYGNHVCARVNAKDFGTCITA